MHTILCVCVYTDINYNEMCVSVKLQRPNDVAMEVVPERKCGRVGKIYSRNNDDTNGSNERRKSQTAGLHLISVQLCKITLSGLSIIGMDLVVCVVDVSVVQMMKRGSA